MVEKNKPSDVFKNYPLSVALKGQAYRLRQLTLDDGDTIIAFGRSLPSHDLLYMRRDISQRSGVDRWLAGVAEGRIHSILAEDSEGTMVGYSTIHQRELEWSQHVADLRVTVLPDQRGTGLGRLLIREAFNIALSCGIVRVTAQMTVDQQASRNLFQELGFKNEALLKDHVRDRDGVLHDLLIMAVNVETFLATREAYGLSG